MRINKFIIPLILLITILASSCSLSASKPPATPTNQPGLNNDTLLQTIDALSTQSGSTQSTISPANTEIIAPTSAGISAGTATFEPVQVDTVISTPVPTQLNGIPVVPITPIATLSHAFSGFAVTHVEMGVDTTNATANCPTGHTFTFNGDIQTNGPGTITYYWDFSNGTKSSEKMLNFSSSGTKRVSATWELGTAGPESSNPFTGWARIYIDAPNHQFFSNENITLNCSSSQSPIATPVPTTP